MYYVCSTEYKIRNYVLLVDKFDEKFSSMHT